MLLISSRSVLLCCLLLLLFTSTTLVASTEEKKLGTKVATTYYFDNRDFNTLAIQIASDKLPLGFTLWGFTDIHSDQKNASERFDMTRTFSEYRLSHSALGDWVGVDGLGLQAEYNASTPNGDDLGRFGFTYKHSVPIPRLGFFGGKNGWLQWRALGLETDGDGWQPSIAYFFPLFEHVSISGFADYNIRENDSNEWIVEPQINVFLTEFISLALEYRFNGFERANSELDGSGWAVGIRVNL